MPAATCAGIQWKWGFLTQKLTKLLGYWNMHAPDSQAFLISSYPLPVRATFLKGILKDSSMTEKASAAIHIERPKPDGRDSYAP